MSDVLVSIVCNAYNHEIFIADAIESFLRQRTDFKFEILIHDDCSSDNTANIIRGYQKKNPEIIKPIYQSKNQYSKGVKITKINSSRAIGKYIALCEGDDYWIDPLKLQKQIDFLEKHPDTSLSVHAAAIVNARTNQEIGAIKPANESKYFTTDEIIFGGGGLFATNSMVFLKKDYFDIPNFYDSSKVGDYPLTIYLSLKGKVHYLNECLSVYRSSVPGSWSEHFESEFEIQRIHYLEIEQLLHSVNQYAAFKHTSIINQTILKDQFTLYLGHGRINEMETEDLDKLYRGFKNDKMLNQYYKSLSMRQKFKLSLNKYTPNLFTYVLKLKRMFY